MRDNLGLDDCYRRAIYTSRDRRVASDRAYAALGRRAFIFGMTKVVAEMEERGEDLAIVPGLRVMIDEAILEETQDLAALHGGAPICTTQILTRGR
jgi:hypothetical protein